MYMNVHTLEVKPLRKRGTLTAREFTLGVLATIGIVIMPSIVEYIFKLFIS